MLVLLDYWLRATLPGYAQPVTKERLGNLPATQWSDTFRAPGKSLDAPR